MDNISEESERLIRDHILPFAKSVIEKNPFANISSSVELECENIICKMTMHQEKECTTKFTTSVSIELIDTNTNMKFKKVYSGCNGKLALCNSGITNNKCSLDYVNKIIEGIKSDEDKMDDIISSVRKNIK